LKTKAIYVPLRTEHLG